MQRALHFKYGLHFKYRLHSNNRRASALLLVIVVALSLAACAKTSHTEEAVDEPAKVEKIQGSDLNRITLEEKAVERLGITTAPVENVNGQAVVKYSALIYDANGSAAVYTNPDKLTYIKAPVTVATVNGENAVLSIGPPEGMQVVTVGAAELFGIDAGIGGNE